MTIIRSIKDKDGVYRCPCCGNPTLVKWIQQENFELHMEQEAR